MNISNVVVCIICSVCKRIAAARKSCVGLKELNNRMVMYIVLSLLLVY